MNRRLLILLARLLGQAKVSSPAGIFARPPQLSSKPVLRTVTAKALCTIVLSCALPLFAQDIPAAKGPGSAITLGATLSGFHSDYGQRTLDGGTLYLDANLYRRIGVEAEARTLSLHSDDGLRQSTYLVGPRFSGTRRTLRPYTKLLAGRGTFQFPYGYAHGSYFVVAAGTGLDWHLNRSVTFRVVDFEYQRWPQFTFGQLRPYGISTGLSLRLF